MPTTGLSDYHVDDGRFHTAGRYCWVVALALAMTLLRRLVRAWEQEATDAPDMFLSTYAASVPSGRPRRR